MFKKIITGLLFLAATSVFGMTLQQLNSASKVELMEIKGIGEVKAKAIIKERKVSEFKSFKDLQRVKGVGKATAENIKNDVTSKAKSKTKKKKA
ncbi:MAG: transporter [Epsilonproteobacteria bacterium (ex Lamellibrachia satsuma)]|nr:MAG: transporter [Epsilonproteobacteria bacterium (ex Lamellibrachia satsuma)]